MALSKEFSFGQSNPRQIFIPAPLHQLARILNLEEPVSNRLSALGASTDLFHACRFKYHKPLHDFQSLIGILHFTTCCKQREQNPYLS